MFGQPSYPAMFGPIDYALCYFRIDVTFEMRTVLSKKFLFIDSLESSDNIFISNRDGGEESTTEERQREKVCERQPLVEKER